MKEYPRIQQALYEGVAQGVFPGAVLLVILNRRVEISSSVGFASLIPEKRETKLNTVFDVASLTKPLITLLSLMILTDKGILEPDWRLKHVSSRLGQSTCANMLVSSLLNHCSGLPDWRPYYLKAFNPGESGKKFVIHKALREPLVYPELEQEVYSDIGYMLLGHLVELISEVSLEEFARRHILDPLELQFAGFNPLDCAEVSETDFAATEDCPWRDKIMLGEVHDENAWVAGGAMGHAGLFATAKEVYHLSRLLPQVKMRRLIDIPYREAHPKRQSALDCGGEGEEIPEPDLQLYGEATALKYLHSAGKKGESDWWSGLMTPTPGASSSGRHFHPRAIGHLGYSGCSFWIDLARDLTVILLTNRVHPSRKNEKIKEFRPRIHDIIHEEVIGL